MFKPFDDFIMVDWSANSKRKTGKDSIWVASLKGASENPSTREECCEYLKDKLLDAIKRKKRILCAFDFCFGFPIGAIEELRKKEDKEKSNLKNWEWLWEYLCDKIDDKPNNENNRFEVASKMNSMISGGNWPFWGFPYNSKEPKPKHISIKKGKEPKNNKLKEKRFTEEEKGGLSVWQLLYNGSVGSQSLLGMARLQELRKDLKEHIGVYPFEDCSKVNIVFAEAYFSHKILKLNNKIKPKDKAQVVAAVEYCKKLQDEKELKNLFVKHNNSDILEEGWIFNEKNY